MSTKSNTEELFELCKEVYVKFPSWKYGLDWMGYVNKGLDSEYINRTCYDPTDDEDDFLWEQEEYDHVPLYTSDYLLEKLLQVTPSIKFYKASNGYIHLLYEPQRPDYETYISDTPLKALLKLAIALHEAGELKGNSL